MKISSSNSSIHTPELGAFLHKLFSTFPLIISLCISPVKWNAVGGHLWKQEYLLTGTVK